MLKKFFVKRIKFLVGVLITIIIGIISANEVFASVNLDYELIDGKYSAVTLDGKNRLFYLKIYKFDGKVVYCVELGKEIDNTVYEYTSDFESFGYSLDDIDYINLVSYYGYEYPSHEDYRYYMAAQEIIWEYLKDVDVTWTDEPSFYGRKMDIEYYKNEIFNLMSLDNVIPSISNNKYEYTGLDKIEINDDNNVLSSYEIIDDGGLDAEIIGNKLVVSDVASIVGEFHLKFRRKRVNDNVGAIFYNDVSQKMYASFDTNNREFSVDITIKGGDVLLHKYDSKNLNNVPYINYYSLKGAKYGLYDKDNNLVSIFETDENGEAILKNIPYGNYTLYELDASYGYKLDNNIYDVSVFNDINHVYVYEDADMKKIQIYKTYGDINPEVDVVFEFFNEDSFETYELITDVDGYGEILLPYGNYLVSQINSIEGYEKVDNFSIRIDSMSDDFVSYYLDDEKIEIQNPKTFDGIFNNIIYGIVSLISLMVIYIKSR